MTTSSPRAVLAHVTDVFSARHPRLEDRISREQARDELLSIADQAPATQDARTRAHGHLSPFPTMTRDLVSVQAVIAWLNVRIDAAGEDA